MFQPSCILLYFIDIFLVLFQLSLCFPGHHTDKWHGGITLPDNLSHCDKQGDWPGGGGGTPGNS